MSQLTFLTSAQKIKKLRVELNMKQLDLEDNNITRAFISMIETEKRGLSKDTARVLVNKFKEKAKILGVELNIDESYLLNTPCEDAEIYCNKKMESDNTEEELNELMFLAENFNLYIIRGNIYIRLADIKYDSKKFSEAFIEYELALDMYNKVNKKDITDVITNRLGLCKLNQELISEAIYYFHKAKILAAENNNLITQKHAMLNLSLCYNKIGMLDKCDFYINKLMEIDDRLKIYIVKAVALQKEGKLDCAIELYEKLLKDERYFDDEYIGLIYNNLATIYFDNKKYDESLMYFEKSEQFNKINNDFYLSLNYIGKSRLYKELNNIEEATKYLLLAREFAKKNNDIECIIKSYTLQSNIYEDLNDMENSLLTQLELYKILKETDNKLEIVKVCNKLIQLYILSNNFDKVNEFSKISIELLDKITKSEYII